MAEAGVLELHRTTPPDNTTPPSSARSSPLSNVSAQTRAFGDKTFDTDGYGGVDLSIVDGSVSADEELLVIFMFSIKSWWLTRFSIVGSGCRLRVRMYLLGRPDVYGDDEDLIAKWYAHMNRKPLPPLTTLPFPVRAFTTLGQEDRKA
jgi:hypothetical protein